MTNTLARRAWDFLSRNKDHISSLTSLIQTVVVVGGVFFALNEFVLKDVAADRAKQTQAFSIFKDATKMRRALADLWNRKDELGDPAKTGDNSVRSILGRMEVDADTTFTNVQLCLDADQCNPSMMLRYFCKTAIQYTALKELASAPVEQFSQAPLLESDADAFNFATRCFPLYDGYNGRPTWLANYIKVFPKSRAAHLPPAK